MPIEHRRNRCPSRAAKKIRAERRENCREKSRRIEKEEESMNETKTPDTGRMKLSACALLAGLLLLSGCFASSGPVEKVCSKDEQGIHTALSFGAADDKSAVESMAFEMDIPYTLLANDEGVDPKMLSSLLQEDIAAQVASHFGIDASQVELTQTDTSLHIKAGLSNPKAFFEDAARRADSKENPLDSSAADHAERQEESTQSDFYKVSELLDALENDGWGCE